MSRQDISRRLFLTLPLAAILAPILRVAAHGAEWHATYAADVGILYNVISLRLTGTITESLDNDGRRYDVTITGQGSNIENRVQSIGRLIDNRWAPTSTTSWFQVRGREAKSEIGYDYGARTVNYRYRGETFFLRRIRSVNDTIQIPVSTQVDDVISAMLNYAENRWPVAGDGKLSTHVVRRRRNENEGPDDVDREARAEEIGR